MILLAADRSLAAKKKRRHGALPSCGSTSKNRVWVFENTSSGRTGYEHGSSWENAMGCVQYTYQNASGRREFLQTDPLRFSAGDVNIYRYCGNDPLNKSDAMGLCDQSTTTTTVTADGTTQTETVTTNADGSTTVTESLTTSDGTTYTVTGNSDGSSSESVTTNNSNGTSTSTTTSADGTTQTTTSEGGPISQGLEEAGNLAQTTGLSIAALGLVSVIASPLTSFLGPEAPITVAAVGFVEIEGGLQVATAGEATSLIGEGLQKLGF